MPSTAIHDVPRDREDAAESATAARSFERVLLEYGGALARLAGSYAQSPSDRDDLLQEIAMNIWQALPEFRGECSERTFVFRIAHNRAINFVARNRSRREASDDNIEAVDASLNPEAELAREQQGERLIRAVRALPIPYRQVVTLALEGMDYAETAQVLGISESNVGARLSRARQMLRKILGGNQ